MVTDYFDVKLETKDLILKKAEFEDWKTIYYNPVSYTHLERRQTT